MLLLCYSWLRLCDFFRFFATQERSESLRYFAFASLAVSLLCLCNPKQCLRLSIQFRHASPRWIALPMRFLSKLFPYLSLLFPSNSRHINALAYPFFSVALPQRCKSHLCHCLSIHRRFNTMPCQRTEDLRFSYALLSIAVASLFNASPMHRSSYQFRFCPMQCRLIARLRFSYAKPIFSYATSSQVNLPWPELRH